MYYLILPAFRLEWKLYLYTDTRKQHETCLKYKLVFIRFLPYISPNDMFILPFCYHECYVLRYTAVCLFVLTHAHDVQPTH
jgi:hypothetical protein